MAKLNYFRTKIIFWFRDENLNYVKWKRSYNDRYWAIRINEQWLIFKCWLG